MAPRILVAPVSPMLDTPLDIRAEGCVPDSLIRLKSSTVDLRGHAWSAEAVFAAAADGTVDVAKQAPIEGSYSGVEPMGLVWSMTRDPARDVSVAWDPLAPAVLELEYVRDDRVLASARVTRMRLAPGTERVEFVEDGVVGVLFLPPGGGAHPGVMLLSGSEGGLHEDDAALLAAHGFAALALAYFGMDGACPDLERVPLEHFGRALQFLAAHPRIRGDHLAVAGGSFGGQAALLIGATFPEVSAVVSIVGSGLVTQGISGDDFLGMMRNHVPPWTLNGKPLPFLPNAVTPDLERQVSAGETIHMIHTFEPALADPELVTAAAIPVERIRGPVLLVSAGDDRTWPCQQLSSIAYDRLAAHDHPFEYTHLHHANAGHLIMIPPFAPTTGSLEEGPGVLFELGGTPAATASAREATWRHTIDFLQRALST